MNKSVSGRRFLWWLCDDMLDPYRKPFEIKVLFWQEKQYSDKVTSEPGLHIGRRIDVIVYQSTVRNDQCVNSLCRRSSCCVQPSVIGG